MVNPDPRTKPRKTDTTRSTRAPTDEQIGRTEMQMGTDEEPAPAHHRAASSGSGVYLPHAPPCQLQTSASSLYCSDDERQLERGETTRANKENICIAAWSSRTLLRSWSCCQSLFSSPPLPLASCSQLLAWSRSSGSWKRASLDSSCGLVLNFAEDHARVRPRP